MAARVESKGFTLIELSVVLTIIALLIGGIMVGQSVIHNAQLMAVIDEYSRYQAAVENFRQKYNALPGDMPNATDYWGSAGGSGLATDTACVYVVSITTATCNGNGDGLLFNGYESYGFWKQLANAKMIEGAYNGSMTNGGGGAITAPGANVPASRYGNNGTWTVFAASLFPSWCPSCFFNANYGTGNVFVFGAGTADVINVGNLLAPKDAWSIDKKIDDGNPGLGNVIADTWGGCTNAANNTDLATTYKLTVTAPTCGLFFLTSF